MKSNRCLIFYIRQYVKLQANLLRAFKDSFPNVSDWDFLLDAPCSGQVTVNGDVWTFRKHGAGLLFRGADGLSVDAHKHLVVSDGVDAWRLLQYIESISAEEVIDLSERSLRKDLIALTNKGDLIQAQYEGLYRLA